MTIMLVGVLSLAQLMAMSTQSNAAARARSLATLLAVSKIEALRSIDWGGAGLAPSPAGTLSANTAGYVEYLDSRGALLNVPGLMTAAPPAGTVYVRRWSVDAPQAIPNAVVIQVVVRRSPDRGAPDAARVTTVRTRKEG